MMTHHSQSDDQSEWTNQMMKIALWFTQERNSDIEFMKFLSAFKWVFNNSSNTSTDCLLNEIIYKFKLADFFDIVTASEAKDFEAQQKMHQQKAQDFIAWTNLTMKHHYNKHHILLLLNSGDFVMLKLHHRYHVPDIKNKKLLIQQVDCFKIKQWIFSLVYKLKLFFNMKIHLMISVINLKSLSPSKDSYKCWVNNHSLPIKKENEMKNNNLDKKWKSFYIEKLLDKHLCYYRHDKKIIEYLVKWISYKSEFNKWYEENLLDNVIKSMLEYELHQNSDIKWIKYLWKLLAEKKKAVIKETEQCLKDQEQHQKDQKSLKRWWDHLWKVKK